MNIDSQQIFEYLALFPAHFSTVTISRRICSVCMTNEKIEQEIVKFC